MLEAKSTKRAGNQVLLEADVSAQATLFSHIKHSNKAPHPVLSFPSPPLYIVNCLYVFAIFIFIKTAVRGKALFIAFHLFIFIMLFFQAFIIYIFIYIYLFIYKVESLVGNRLRLTWACWKPTAFMNKYRSFKESGQNAARILLTAKIKPPCKTVTPRSNPSNTLLYLQIE